MWSKLDQFWILQWSWSQCNVGKWCTRSVCSVSVVSGGAREAARNRSGARAGQSPRPAARGRRRATQCTRCPAVARPQPAPPRAISTHRTSRNEPNFSEKFYRLTHVHAREFHPPCSKFPRCFSAVTSFSLSASRVKFILFNGTEGRKIHILRWVILLIIWTDRFIIHILRYRFENMYFYVYDILESYWHSNETSWNYSYTYKYASRHSSWCNLVMLGQVK